MQLAACQIASCWKTNENRKCSIHTGYRKAPLSHAPTSVSGVHVQFAARCRARKRNIGTRRTHSTLSNRTSRKPQHALRAPSFSSLPNSCTMSYAFRILLLNTKSIYVTCVICALGRGRPFLISRLPKTNTIMPGGMGANTTYDLTQITVSSLRSPTDCGTMPGTRTSGRRSVMPH